MKNILSKFMNLKFINFSAVPRIFATTYMVADNITFEAQNIEKIQKQKQIIHLHPQI